MKILLYWLDRYLRAVGLVRAERVLQAIEHMPHKAQAMVFGFDIFGRAFQDMRERRFMRQLLKTKI